LNLALILDAVTCAETWRYDLRPCVPGRGGGSEGGQGARCGGPNPPTPGTCGGEGVSKHPVSAAPLPLG